MRVDVQRRALSFPVPLVIPGRALPACLATLSVVTRVMVGPHAIDDADITFRYSRNIAEGLGFVYNAGQHVIGTTTPLWTLLLALLYRIGLHDLPSVATSLAAVLDGCTVWALYLIVQRLGWRQPWPALLALGFAVAPISLRYASSGMETSLFITCVVTGYAAVMHDRVRLAAVLLSLATLTRPEGMLTAALVLAVPLIRSRMRSFAIWYLPPVLAWGAFAYWWTGKVLPQSMAAKVVAYAHQTGVIPTIAEIISLYGLLILTLVLLTPCWRRGLRSALKQHPSARPLGLLAPCLCLAYIIAGTHGIMLFQWYLVPLLPSLLFLLMATFQRLPAKIGLSLAGAVLVLTSILPLPAEMTREAGYVAAARWLRLPPTVIVAAPEIGAFGYNSRATILDTIGLVSPEAVRYYPLPARYASGVMPPALLRHARPQYIVSLDVFIDPQMRRARWFEHGYRLVKTIPDVVPAWRAKRVLIYRRQGTWPRAGFMKVAGRSGSRSGGRSHAHPGR